MEYARVVGQSTGVAGGGGSGDITGQVMDAISDAVDQVSTLPAEVLVGAAIAALVVLLLIRR
jgi:hypothetical protein